MIAKDSGTGKSFGGLVSYLENGKRGEKQDRVAWFETHNLDAATMREAALTMKDFANENSRVEKPVYHFSINWHADESEQVDQALAMDITRSALADLGLENHQALVVAHKDTDHFHVHVVANRIDPETGKAWTGSFSKMKLEQTMARLSLEHGFDVVPGYHNALDLGIDPPVPENAQTTEALRFEERTETPSFDTTARVELVEVFEDAESWAGLETALGERGYHLEARGRGLVVGDGAGNFAKASAIGREFSRPQLEQRFGEPFAMVEPAADVAPADREAVRKSLKNDLKAARSWQEFTEAAGDHGYDVRRKGRGLILEAADHEVKPSAVDRGLSLGRLEKQYSESFSQYIERDPEARAAHFQDAAADIEKAVTALENYERTEAFATELFIQRQEVLTDTQESFDQVRAVARGRERLERTFAGVYERPQKALDAFDARRRQAGLGKALRELGEGPKTFGRLKVRGPLARFNDRHRDNLAALRAAGEGYREAVAAVSANKERIDADLSRRNNPDIDKALADVRKDLKRDTWRRLENDVLKAAEKVKAGDLERLPFRTRLRGRVIAEKVRTIADDKFHRERAEEWGLYKGGRYRRWPDVARNATPGEARAFEAASRYARARHALEEAVPWRHANAKVSREMFAELREAAEKLHDEGKGAKRYFGRFGIDARQLANDAGAGRLRRQVPARTQRLSSLLNSKAPRIRVRFTTVLRLLGIPVPRIPIPRAPKMSVKARGKGMARELVK